MKRVFLDTNVVLDLLLDRKPHNAYATHLFQQTPTNAIKLCVSSVTITDVNYIIGKFEGTKVAKRKTDKLLGLVDVENVGQSTVVKASKSKFEDFEDGVQNFCALEAKHTIIVTRNIKGFKKSKLAIMTPKEFIARMEASL